MAATPPDRALDAADRGRARGRKARPPGLRGRRARPSWRRCPTTCTPRCWPALRARRDRRSSTPTRREALEAAWAGPDDRHDRHRVGQVAVLQPADARRAVLATPRRARCTCTPPRRWRRTRRARSTRSGSARPSGPRSTTATRRARSAPRSAARRTSSSPTPTCSTSGSCPTTRRGRTSSRTSRSSSSTRRTSTAASSARTWRTCCAGCGGSPPPTARRRGSCWRAPRSPTRSSWPSG